MPTTRKKVIKTVYKDENDSEADAGDFSDSGSDAVISQPSSSEDEEPDIHSTSEYEKKKGKKQRVRTVKCPKTTKRNTLKHTLLTVSGLKRDEFNLDPEPEPTFSVKDLTEADKQLPSILNLSESDSSDDETPKVAPKAVIHNVTNTKPENEDCETETCTEYKDVWSSNLKESEEIAKKTFLDLEKHKTILEEAKESIQKYNIKRENNKECDVNDLLALGEEAIPSVSPPKTKRRKGHKAKCDSDSELEDWEEVAEGKVPQQGLQLVVDFPDAVCRKSKKVDVEMMMKRKINRVKKEYQVYMHKVHVLCWLGHGNYVSRVLNDQDIMSAALTLIPSKESYPGERVDMKYVEQVTTWFKDKLKVKFDKHEGKFRPKAPPLKDILLQQIKTGVVTSKKYIVFIFVSMLRAVGLQCRIMLNFTTLPIKPPITELCSLSTKPKSNEKNKVKEDLKIKGPKNEKKKYTKKTSSDKIPQLDGNNDSLSESDFDSIMQVDGNDDGSLTNEMTIAKNKIENTNVEDVSPPKRRRINLSLKRITSDVSKGNKKETKATTSNENKNIESQSFDKKISRKSLSLKRNQSVVKNENNHIKPDEGKVINPPVKNLSLRRLRNTKTEENPIPECKKLNSKAKKPDAPEIIVTADESGANISSEYFDNVKQSESKRSVRARKRAYTCNPSEKQDNKTADKTVKKPRGKSAPGNSSNKSKYFDEGETEKNLNAKKKVMSPSKKKPSKENDLDNDATKRVSHRDLVKAKAKPKNDVTNDLVDIIKKRVKEAKGDVKKGKISKSSDEDSDFLPEMTDRQKASTSKKSIAKAGTSRKIDRRILSTDDEAPSVKIDTWCEIFVEELEQWVAVDIIKGRVHCVNEIYRCATHPVNYVVGWDNNNYLKDLTRRYVPQWNTVTRKQRVDHSWWNTALKPWLGPRTPRDREEDETLDRMQLDAPLPKSIAEYKNHPLYALKRHLLKFEAIYPPDAATLGFVRGEAVYARECVYVCRSRDTWLKEAKVVRLGQHPYKVVKARPKWDKLSNKLITDKPLEVFGPWQVQDYEPPVAENGIVPRNAYGNVELFKQCMLPKGTVHIKLPGLNRVAKKLNIDCAPAMTGFDFNGGWSHPVYDGFVVCEEFEDIIINAWHEDQEEQERKEMEKTEARVYGNWRRLIKGLLIRERLKLKYGFAEPSTSQDKKKSAGPRLTVKKKFLEK